MVLKGSFLIEPWCIAWCSVPTTANVAINTDAQCYRSPLILDCDEGDYNLRIEFLSQGPSKIPPTVIAPTAC